MSEVPLYNWARHTIRLDVAGRLTCTGGPAPKLIMTGPDLLKDEAGPFRVRVAGVPGQAQGRARRESRARSSSACGPDSSSLLLSSLQLSDTQSL